MAIRFFCPSGHQLSVPDSQAGQKIRCSLCRKTMYVPESSAGNTTDREADSDGGKTQPDATEGGEPQPQERAISKPQPRSKPAARRRRAKPAAKAPPRLPKPSNVSDEARPGDSVLDQIIDELSTPKPSTTSDKADSLPPPLPEGKSAERADAPSESKPPNISEKAQPGDSVLDEIIEALSTPKPSTPPGKAGSSPPPLPKGEPAEKADAPSRSKPKPPAQKPPAPLSMPKPPKSTASGAKPPPLPTKSKRAEAKPESGRLEPKRPPPKVETDAKSKPQGEPKAKSKPTEPKTRSARRKRRRDRRRAKREANEPAAAATPEADKQPPQPTPERPKRTRTRPVKVPRQPKLMPADAYQPDAGRILTVKWLALILSLVVAFSLCPVFVDAKTYLNLAEAPWFARIVLLLAAVQVVYIAWMLNRPDWASVWVVMVVFAVVATIYGMATAMALSWMVREPMPLGLEQVRHSAKGWCGSVLLAMSLATYLCGRTSAKWRRSFELERASKGKVPSTSTGSPLA